MRAWNEATSTSDRSGIMPGRLKGQRRSESGGDPCTADGRNRPDTDRGPGGPCMAEDSLTALGRTHFVSEEPMVRARHKG